MNPVRAAARWAGLALALGFVTLLCLELGARALVAWNPDWPSLAEIRATLEAPADEAGLPDAIAAPGRSDEMGNVVHPYLGFVRSATPGVRNRVNGRPVDLPVNEFGFFGPAPPFDEDSGRLRVGLTGGSVATELFLYGRRAMAEALRERGLGDVEIFSLALGGMKQPQQLMALAWMLALGAHFDVLVNLDGFNELVLALEQVELAGTYPDYPVRWRLLAANRLDLPAVELLGRISAGRAERERWRSWLSRPGLRESALALALWHVIGVRSASREAELEGRLDEQLARGDPGARGPALSFASRPALLEHAAGVWRRSSREMWQLARGSGITYLHFLQPSQYLRGARELTAREQRRAVRQQSMAQVGVTRGYPLLREAGRSLREEGVPFEDLTGVFRDVDGEIYRDECCHLTDAGYELLARAIAERIAGAVQASGTP